MNEEIHDSSNIPLCISSPNDTTYYINLENNRRRFTVLEGKNRIAMSVRRVSGAVTPSGMSLCLATCFSPDGRSGRCSRSRGGRACEGCSPYICQLSSGKEQRNGPGAQGLLSPTVGGGVGVGCLRKEESPSLPKPSVWVESCPLIPPHSSPGCSQTRGFIAFIRFKKCRTHGLQ